MVEENYFFRLSAYADRLLEHYEAHPEAVEPETRRNEVLSTIRGGLQDFSISRTTFDWGIPLPWDPKHVCYVWFDALTNYITAAGYADDPERFARMWPANIHSIGKDILRFHAIYWPAMLMAGDVEPPTQVWAHGFLTVGGKKMSKTNATGIHPFELLDVFGVDSYRYYFMREIQFGQDGSFSYEAMVERHNADLANGLGNLTSRVLAMLASNFDGVVPEFTVAGAESDLPSVTAEAAERYQTHMQARGALAGADRHVGDRRAGQPLPGGEGALEDQGRGETRRAREHPLRVGRNAPHPRGADLPDHAASGERPVVPARHPGTDRGAAPPTGRRVGRPRPRNDDRRRARACSRGSKRSSGRRSGEPPRLQFRLSLRTFMFHVKLPRFTPR